MKELPFVSILVMLFRTTLSTFESQAKGSMFEEQVLEFGIPPNMVLKFLILLAVFGSICMRFERDGMVWF